MDNTAFKLELEAHGYKFYIPTDATQYHISRQIEAMRYNVYASSGITPETLCATMDEIIARANDNNFKQARTDIAALANAVKYCTKYPVDEHCTVRIGAVLCFIEYTAQDGNIVVEDPEKPLAFYQQKKEQLAMDYPDIYDFFLSWGAVNSPNYDKWLQALQDTEYLIRRRKTLLSMIPEGSLLFRNA